MVHTRALFVWFGNEHGSGRVTTGAVTKEGLGTCAHGNRFRCRTPETLRPVLSRRDSQTTPLTSRDALRELGLGFRVTEGSPAPSRHARCGSLRLAPPLGTAGTSFLFKTG